jgi:cytosine/adenosine deaminase-related metal-dependent hydrolase
LIRYHTRWVFPVTSVAVESGTVVEEDSLESGIGSLEAGRDADLAAFSLADIIPLGDPEAAVVFSLYRRSAMFVAVAGRVLVADGQVLHGRDEWRHAAISAGDGLARWHISETMRR